MPRWSLLIFLAAALTAAVAACDRGSPGADPTATQVGAQKIFATPQTTFASNPIATVEAESPVDEPVPVPTLSRVPPPRIFESEWATDTDSIAPGEPVTITLELKSVWDRLVEFNEFPTSMTLTHVDTRVETSVPLELEGAEESPGPLEPGEGLTVVAAVSPSVSASLQPGRYRVNGFKFSYTRVGLGQGPSRRNMSSDPLFVVIPPEGVLDKVLTVGQTREAGGAQITLERIHFTPERSTVSVFAVPPAQRTSPPQPAVAGTSTPVPSVQPGSTPTPASRADQPSWDGDVTELTAFYSLDGGRWRLMSNFSYREGPDGVHWQWPFDPVSVNAKTLEIIIVPRGRPGGGGASSSPGEGASSSWEWHLSLQRPDLEYSMGDLAEWNRTVRDVIWQVPGITYTYLDEPKNRIRIGMQPRRGAREDMEAAIASVDVPRGAALIDVGCSGIKPWPIDDGNPPAEKFLRAVEYSLEVVDQASYGETVGMTLTLRNVSDAPVDFLTGGRPPYDFVVATPDGDQVWHWKCAKVIQLPLDNQTLEPGDEMEFEGEWEQVDNRGEPVPPGVYVVRAVLDMDYPEKLVTETREVEIVR